MNHSVNFGVVQQTLLLLLSLILWTVPAGAQNLGNLHEQQNSWPSGGDWNFGNVPRSLNEHTAHGQEIRRSFQSNGQVKGHSNPPPTHYGHDLFLPTMGYPRLWAAQSAPQMNSIGQSPNLNVYDSSQSSSWNWNGPGGGVSERGGRGVDSKSGNNFNNFFDYFQNGKTAPTPPPLQWYKPMGDNGGNFEYQKKTLVAMPVVENPVDPRQNEIPPEATSGWGMKPYRKPLLKINLSPVMDEVNALCSSLFPNLDFQSFCTRKPRLGYPVAGA